MLTTVYTPIVKTKRGEAKALAHLTPEIKKAIIPFFDVLALGEDAGDGCDVHMHLIKQAANMATAWKDQGRCYVDLFDVKPSARGMHGEHPAKIIHDVLESKFVKAIPVVGLERDIAYKLAIRVIVLNGADAIAIRLDVEDIQLPGQLVPKITKLVSELGATELPLHVFLDFRSLVGTSSDIVQARTNKAIYEIQKLKPARIVFAASAMVPNMSGFKRNTVNSVPRLDYLNWRALSKQHKSLDFADYGIVHPDYFDFDPRLIKPAAKIRYATDGKWLIIKGACWRDNTSQHHELSIMLDNTTEFRGAGTWGSDYIASAIAGRQKYGSLETWVTIDQNNHISHTVAQLAGALTPGLVSHPTQIAP